MPITRRTRPKLPVAPGTVDPDIKNDRTREFIVGFDRQFGSVFAVGGSYIWRKYDWFNWQDRVGFTSDNMRAVHLHAAGRQLPKRPRGARPSPISSRRFRCRQHSFAPTCRTAGATTTASELTFQKRHANRWSFNASYAYNDAVDVWDSLSSTEDPTCPWIEPGRRNPVIACPGWTVCAGGRRQRHRQRVLSTRSGWSS